MLKLSIITPTHNPQFLADLWYSIKDQGDFEWIICTNNCSINNIDKIKNIIKKDKRVKLIHDPREFTGVGSVKKFAFSQGTGDILIEVDHDDLLVPGALDEIRKVFEDPEIGFVYSDFADFVEGAEGQGNLTYRHPDVRPGWYQSGFSFYDVELGGVRPGKYECVKCLPPTAQVVSHIYTAPNHVRCWRKSVYEKLGGHNPNYKLADDHELCVRTFLETKIFHIEKPLYLYRISPNNTWSKSVGDIKQLSDNIQSEYIERLVLHECKQLDLPVYDLGGDLNRRSGWLSVDIEGTPNIKADLTQPWPFQDNSVGAFRAMDLLEHLPDKMFTMKEIHRCLRPGGWLLSMTPSTDGRGADMDPTHYSRWNENSFWYWTRESSAQYIRNKTILFKEVQLLSEFPSDWHKVNHIPYVRANLTKR